MNVEIKEIFSSLRIWERKVLVCDNLSGETIVGLDKRRSFVITVRVFGHRSDIYIYVHELLLLLSYSLSPRYLFIRISELNLLNKCYEMFPVFSSLQQLKLFRAK